MFQAGGDAPDLSPIVDAWASGLSWADSSWSDLATLMQCHYDGVIDARDYLHVGDVRTVSLSAIPAVNGLNDGYDAQDIQLVIVAEDHYDMSDGSGVAAFVIGQVDCLALNESAMNTELSTIGGWDAMPLRTWCNNNYKNALPSGLVNMLKQVDTVASGGAVNSRDTQVAVTSSDWCFFPAAKEVDASWVEYTGYALAEVEQSLSQYEYYETQQNQSKNLAGQWYTGPNRWWTRSIPHQYAYPNENFYQVYSGGGLQSVRVTNSSGVAPHMCI